MELSSERLMSQDLIEQYGSRKSAQNNLVKVKKQRDENLTKLKSRISMLSREDQKMQQKIS